MKELPTPVSNQKREPNICGFKYFATLVRLQLISESNEKSAVRTAVERSLKLMNSRRDLSLRKTSKYGRKQRLLSQSAPGEQIIHIDTCVVKYIALEAYHIAPEYNQDFQVRICRHFSLRQSLLAS